jgi:PASTA domain
VSEAATYRCSLDGAAPAPCATPQELSGLAVGTHTLQVWATDAAGNEDPSPATRTWTITAPAREQSAGGTGTGTVTGSDTGTSSATETVAAPPATRPATPIITTRTTAATLPTCRVPKLKGKTLRAARTALAKANCALGKVTRRRSSRAPGRVVAQKVTAGTTQAAGKKVAVVVSKR